MSTYIPTDWVDGTTLLDAAHFDNMEAELVLLDSLKVPDPAGLDEKWLKVEGGAMVWVDPPAGGGGGSVEYENAWGAATPYQAGDVVEHEGVQYLAVNPSTNSEPAPPAAPSSFTPVPLVTALPTPLFDGQEVILCDSLTAPTYQWRLRYVAAKATNRWVFVGGAEAYARIDTDESFTTVSTWVDLATVGPSFVVPVAGIYETWGNASYWSTVLSVASVDVVVGAAAGTVGANADVTTGGANHSVNVPHMKRMTVAAGAELRMRYYAYVAGTHHFRGRWLRVRPLAVGG